MDLFVLGLVIGCAGCALIALILFWALGLTIVGRNKRKDNESVKENRE